MRKKLMLFVLNCIPFFAISQQIVFLDSAQIANDLNHLQGLVFKYHPKFHDESPKQSFINAVDNLKKECNSLTTRIEYWRKLTVLLNSINDGHTGVVLPNFEEFKNAFSFPFEIYFQNDTIFLKPQDGKDSNSKKKILVKINNIEIEQFKKEIFPLLNSESNILSDLYFEVFFQFYYSILWGDKPVNEISYIENNKIIDVNTLTVTLEQLNKSHNSKDISLEIKEVEDVKIAWVNFENSIDSDIMLEFLQQLKREIEKNKIKNLVIDIRQNSGGTVNGAIDFLDYLLKEDYYFADYAFINTAEKKSELINSQKKISLITSSPFWIFNKYKRKVLLKKNGKMIAMNNNIIRSKKKEKFKGNVFVLIGRRTYSSAVSFASILQCKKRGILIGQTSAGKTQGYIDSKTFVLPESKLAVYISTKQFREKCSKKPHLEPDVFCNENEISDKLIYENIIKIKGK
ncbi:MAG: hypothetical protein JXR58_07280 [Bacteroidales bacterium]|nr:hypothetical protein [Bacteroidales bacterium]